MPAPKHNLSPKHLDNLNKVLDSCAQTRELCEACERSFIDVSKEKAANDEQERIAKALKANFFPMDR